VQRRGDLVVETVALGIDPELVEGGVAEVCRVHAETAGRQV
jgi:hypothetical protein